jgi:transposase
MDEVSDNEVIDCTEERSMAKFKAYRKGQLCLLPPSLDDYVPQGHLARLVYEVVEGLDTSAIENRYSELGQNTYHPKILLKLLFYGYATGVRSGRRIAARCETDTAYMYLSELYQPDFRTINDFRKNHLAVIEGYFVEIVRMCRGLGMVKVGEVMIDGSKMKANAASKRSKDKTTYEAWLEDVEKQIKDMLREAGQEDEREDELYGDERGDELPEDIRTKESLKEKIKEVLGRFKEEKQKINLTDPDSRFMKLRQGGIASSYNCQVAAVEGQVIVAADVVAEENDRQQLAPMVEETERVMGEKVEEIIADAGYSSYENYEYLSQRSKEGYIPDQYFEKVKRGEYRSPEQRYHKDNFKYDSERDVYLCPEGKELRFYKERNRDKGVRRKQRVYRGRLCSGCPVLGQCTGGRYREIACDKREHLLEEMRQRLLSGEGKEKYKRRLFTVEPIFGHLKYNLGYRTFLLRTLDKVRGEFKLMCIGHNLRKILTWKMAMAAA